MRELPKSRIEVDEQGFGVTVSLPRLLRFSALHGRADARIVLVRLFGCLLASLCVRVCMQVGVNLCMRLHLGSRWYWMGKCILKSIGPRDGPSKPMDGGEANASCFDRQLSMAE